MTDRLEKASAGNGDVFSGRLYSVSPYGNLTGAPISSLNHAQLLSRNFASVCLVLPGPGEILDRARAAGVPTLVLPVENRGLRLRWFRRTLGRDLCTVVGSRWRYFRALCRQFRREPGIIHVHSRASIAPLALGAARLCGLPSVLHVREPADQSWVGRLWARTLTGLASAVVCVSDGIRQGYGTGICRSAKVIYNFMPMPPLLPPRVTEIPVVLMPARMGPRKGCDVFLETCRLLNAGGNAFRAWMVGGWISENDRQSASSFLRINHLESVVVDRGVEADMASVYSQADILVLTSRRDPLPRVVMEAMGHGIPVVATRVDGIPEMVDDGVTGFLVESEDAEGFARAVKKLLEDRDLRLRMGAAGRERARKLFSPETYAAAMLALYREIGARA
jgi:glycosyltransferase involved in cell wall biosynthesis